MILKKLMFLGFVIFLFQVITIEPHPIKLNQVKLSILKGNSAEMIEQVNVNNFTNDQLKELLDFARESIFLKESKTKGILQILFGLSLFSLAPSIFCYMLKSFKLLDISLIGLVGVFGNPSDSDQLYYFFLDLFGHKNKDMAGQAACFRPFRGGINLSIYFLSFLLLFKGFNKFFIGNKLTERIFIVEFLENKLLEVKI